MNPKISKIIGDIEKTKEKIAEHQTRLRELERLKIEVENADIVAMVRGIDIPPGEFEAFALAFMEQRKNTTVPDITDIPADDSGENIEPEKEDGEIEE